MGHLFPFCFSWSWGFGGLAKREVAAAELTEMTEKVIPQILPILPPLAIATIPITPTTRIILTTPITRTVALVEEALAGAGLVEIGNF